MNSMKAHRFHLQYVLVGRTGGIISGPTRGREYLDSQVGDFIGAEIAPVYINSENMDAQSENEILPGSLSLEGATEEEGSALWDILDDVAGDSAKRSMAAFTEELMKALSAMEAPPKFIEELLSRMSMDGPSAPIDNEPLDLS